MTSNANLTVVEAGLLSLLMDAGRDNYQSHGYSQSGPMDMRAYRRGDSILEQSNTTQIEFIGQIVVRCDQSIGFAVSGPSIDITVNDMRYHTDARIEIHAGDIVKLTPNSLGQRHYLSVEGGFECPLSLGSSATVLRENIGGLTGQGQPLRVGDIVPIGGFNPTGDASHDVSNVSDYREDIPIDVTLGYQASSFESFMLKRFFASDYRVTPAADRMGFRLEGRPVTSTIHTMHSEGIALGAIQCPPDGQPIIMMRDRQTIGGYPKLGCVAPYDIDRLSQITPGKSVSFNYVSVESARANMLLIERGYKRLGAQFLDFK